MCFVDFAFAKSYKHNIGIDTAGIGGRKTLLPGEILLYRKRYKGKSAEVIVVVEYELRTETAEVSQSNEGLIRQLADVPNSTGIGQKQKPCFKRDRVKQNIER